MGRPMYLVMVAMDWTSLTVSVGGLSARMIPSTDPDEPIRFCPVYKTKRAAQKIAKIHGLRVVVIREVTQ